MWPTVCRPFARVGARACACAMRCLDVTCAWCRCVVVMLQLLMHFCSCRRCALCRTHVRACTVYELAGAARVAHVARLVVVHMPDCADLLCWWSSVWWCQRCGGWRGAVLRARARGHGAGQGLRAAHAGGVGADAGRARLSCAQQGGPSPLAVSWLVARFATPHQLHCGWDRTPFRCPHHDSTALFQPSLFPEYSPS